MLPIRWRIGSPDIYIDPYRDGAVSLYNVCNADKAEIFDTGRGHTIPRGGPLVAELAEAVRDMISQA